MTGNTHIIGGLAASLAVAQVTNYEPILLVGAGLVGALIPDICHSGSTIGRKFKALSKVINTLFGHRSFTHSLLFLVLIGFLLTSFVDNESIIIGILVGIGSHLLLDMGTKNGIKLLFPLTITVRFPVTARTGGTVEYLIFAALSVLTVYFGYGVFGKYI